VAASGFRSRAARQAASVGGLSFVSYRTDTTARLVHIPPMPRYSFGLDDAAPLEDATEEFAGNQAAMEHAKLVAKDLARSTAARHNLRVVVRNEAGDEIGDVSLQVDPR
jgi:hypothetical protein